MNHGNLERSTADTSAGTNDPRVWRLTKIAWHDSLLICSPGWLIFIWWQRSAENSKRHRHRSAAAPEAKFNFPDSSVFQTLTCGVVLRVIYIDPLLSLCLEISDIAFRSQRLFVQHINDGTAVHFRAYLAEPNFNNKDCVNGHTQHDICHIITFIIRHLRWGSYE